MRRNAEVCQITFLGQSDIDPGPNCGGGRWWVGDGDAFSVFTPFCCAKVVGHVETREGSCCAEIGVHGEEGFAEVGGRF